MILSDREIKSALGTRAIYIDPDPRLDESLWASTAIDLRLDDELLIWNNQGSTPSQILRTPDDPEFDFEDIKKQCTSRKKIDSETGHVLAPGDFLLGWTKEKIKLPERSRIAARVEGKSSLARLGIGVHVTAPTIHAGFGFKLANPHLPGRAIQLEIFHHGTYPVRLCAGMKVCQLIFEEVHGTPERGYSGRFADQGPQS